MVPEAVNVEFCNMGSILVDSSRVVVIVSSAPIVVVANNSLFVPLIKLHTFDRLLAKIFGSTQPVWLQDATPMSRVAAEAALGFLWEHNPSFTINNKVLAGSSEIRDEGITELIELTGESVQSGAVVGSIVVEDAIDLSGNVFHDVLLVEGLDEGGRPNRRVESHHSRKEYCQDDAVGNFHA